MDILGMMILALAFSTRADEFSYPIDWKDINDDFDLSTDTVFTLGEPQQILWITSEPAVKLSLWQKGSPDHGQVLSQNCQGGSFWWSGRPSQDLKNGVVFFLQTYNITNASADPLPILASSRNFNITDPAVSESTSPTPLHSNATSPEGASTSFSGGLKTEVGLGIAVGIGIACISIILFFPALAFILYRRRKKLPLLLGPSTRILSAQDLPLSPVSPFATIPTTYPKAELPAMRGGFSP